jgi:hypothetical protein
MKKKQGFAIVMVLILATCVATAFVVSLVAIRNIESEMHFSQRLHAIGIMEDRIRIDAAMMLKERLPSITQSTIITKRRQIMLKFANFNSSYSPIPIAGTNCAGSPSLV